MVAQEKPRRRRRRWLYAIGAVVILIVLLIVLIPSLVSWGVGQGSIRSAIERNINGAVSLGEVKLGWLGHQSVRELKVTDPDGKQIARVNLSIERGLLNLLLGSSEPINIKLSGELQGQIKDGRLSFAQLIRKDAAPTPTPTTPSPSGEPFRLPKIPAMTVNVEGLDVTIDNLDTGQLVKLEAFQGKASYQGPTSPITIDFNGKTNIDGTAGSIRIAGLGDGLFDHNGAISLREAPAKLDIEATRFPAKWADINATLDSMVVSIASDDLTEKIVASIQAKGTQEGSRQSNLQLDASVEKVLDSQGGLSFQGGSANINLQASNLPIVAEGVNGIVEEISATVVSADLTKAMSVGIEGTTRLQGSEGVPSPLFANLEIQEPFAANGQSTISIDRITGAARGDSVPTALLEPVFAGSETLSKIQMGRDIGPTVNLNASFGSGERRDVNLKLVGRNAQLELIANVQPNDPTAAITGSHLLLSLSPAHPDLVRHLANINVDRPTPFEIRLTNFALPPVNAAGSRPLSAMAASGSLRLPGPTSMHLAGTKGTPAEPVALELQNVEVKFESPRLGEHIIARGSAKIDGGDVTFNETITNLFDTAGALAPANTLPVGTLKVSKLLGTTLTQFAPEQKDILDRVIGPAFDATVNTTVDGGNLIGEVTLKGSALDSRWNVVKRPDALSIQSGIVTLQATPELAAALQRNSEEPIQLAGPATVTLDAQQIDLLRQSDGSYQLADQPVNATLSINSMVLQSLPGVAEPVGVDEFVAELGMEREGSFRAYTVVGDVVLRRADADRVLTRGRYNIKLNQKIGTTEPFIPHIDLGLTDLSMVHLEQLIAMTPGTISQWTGEQGELSVHLEKKQDQYEAHLRPMLPNLKGDFTAQSDGKIVSLSGKTTSFTLNKTALEQRMNPSDASAAAGAAVRAAEDQEPSSTDTRIRVAEDVPLTLAVDQLRFPLGGWFAGKAPIDPASVNMNLKLAGGPMTIINPGDVRTRVSDLDIALSTANLSQGIAFALKGKAEAQSAGTAAAPPTEPEGVIGRAAANDKREPAASQPQSGTIDITGTLVDLLSADNTLQPATAKLQMNADIKSMPTAIADALANMEGLLVAAVGPLMDAKFVANDFSVNSGTLDARIDTPNGWLEAPLRGREFAFRTVRDQSIKAELAFTQAFRDRLLQNIHPILADVRSSEHPLQVDLPLLMVPVNEQTKAIDVSRMRADININVGKVELDSGSKTLSVLQFFGEAEKRKTIPGEIEPIVATIRNGVVKYEKFAVHIDKYTLNYVGEVNLVKRTVDVRTEVPLKALGQAVRELEPYADKIVVPLVTRGTFGTLKTEIDPDFDMGKAALDAGFRGGLQQLLEGEGGLLDELLKGKEKKPK